MCDGCGHRAGFLFFRGVRSSCMGWRMVVANEQTNNQKKTMNMLLLLIFGQCSFETLVQLWCG